MVKKIDISMWVMMKEFIKNVKLDHAKGNYARKRHRCREVCYAVFSTFENFNSTIEDFNCLDIMLINIV